MKGLLEVFEDHPVRDPFAHRPSQLFVVGTLRVTFCGLAVIELELSCEFLVLWKAGVLCFRSVERQESEGIGFCKQQSRKCSGYMKAKLEQLTNSTNCPNRRHGEFLKF
ncbi:hypothetical protein AOLI_G00025400 [Acnodon oligacanthus]